MSDILFPTDTSGVTPEVGDIILIADVSDSNNPKDCTLAELPVSTATNTALGLKVDKTTTVNGHALSGNVTITASDVGAPSGSGTSSGTNTGDQTISDATISTTDITTNNVSTSKHGFAPKLPNDATKYLDGTGAYTVPAGSGGSSTLIGLTDVAITTPSNGQALIYETTTSKWKNTTLAGGGNMLTAVYDPTSVAGDVFDSNNHVYTPSGNLTATTTQTAIDELELMKANVADLSSNITLYFTNVASDIGGYMKIVTDISDTDYNDTAVDIDILDWTSYAVGVERLIASSATTAGLIVGAPGVFNITTIGNIQKTNGNSSTFAEFYFKVYKRDSGGTETLVCTSSSTGPVNPDIQDEYYQFSASGVFNDGTFVATDRLVVKFYGKKLGGSNPEYSFQFGGTSPVRTLLPVPVSVTLGNYYDKDETDALFDGVVHIAGNEIMTGNKTIEVNSPSATPSFKVKADNNGIQLLSWGSTAGNYGVITNGSNALYSSLGRMCIAAEGAGSEIVLSTGGAGNNRMIISQSGNIGIGTATPSEKLEVNGNISQSASSNTIHYIDRNTYSDGCRVMFRTGGADKWGVGQHPFFATDFIIMSEVSATAILRLTEGNDLLINGQNWTSAWTEYTVNALGDSGSIGSVLYSDVGRYKVIGKTCYLQINANWATKGTITGQVRFNLPSGIVPKSGWEAAQAVVFGTNGTHFSNMNCYVQADPNGTIVVMGGLYSGYNWSSAPATNITLRGTMVFEIV